MEKTPSGIPGLDEILGGGLPRSYCILLAGGPGSGKTTLALQYLYQGIERQKENGVFVTLMESPEELRRNAAAFGWNLAEKERRGELLIIDARPVITTREGIITQNEYLFKGEILPFTHILKLIMEGVERVQAKRVVIDSITVLTMQYVNRFYIRQALLGFIQGLADLGVTSLLLSEELQGGQKTPLEYAVAHGVILLHYDRVGSSMTRSLQVLKMRGVKHGEFLYLMELTDRGIVIHPEETVTF